MAGFCTNGAFLAYVPLVSCLVNRPRPYASGTLPNPPRKSGEIMKISSDVLVNNDGFAALDDSALLAWRAKARGELERLPPHSPGYAELTERYDLSTREVEDRARLAWAADARGSRP